MLRVVWHDEAVEEEAYSLQINPANHKPKEEQIYSFTFLYFTVNCPPPSQLNYISSYYCCKLFDLHETHTAALQKQNYKNLIRNLIGIKEVTKNL